MFCFVFPGEKEVFVVFCAVIVSVCHGQVTFVCHSPTLCSIVMVVGAGRGPLVRAALRAAGSTERKVKVYAIEKNPGAVIT